MKTILRTNLTVIIIVALSAGLLTSSCGRKSREKAEKKLSEKLIEKVIEKQTGQKADIDLNDNKMVIESDEGRIEFDGEAKAWPKAIPNDIPEFTYGKVTGVTTTTDQDGDKSWTVIFESVGSGFIDKYNDRLKDKGFETNFMKIGDTGGTISAESGNLGVFVMGDENNATVTVHLKKEE